MAKTISADRQEAFREAFQLFDRDGDGCITTGELGTVLRALGKSPTEAEVKRIVAEVDPDSRGLLDFNEFLSIMARDIREFDNEKDLQEAWKVFDKEHKGSIRVSELRHVLANIGEKLSPEELEDLIREADPSGTGAVQYAEFIKMMQAR